MKYLIVACLVAPLIIACGNGNIGGTQTGNPAVVAMSYSMVQQSPQSRSRGTGASVQNIMIEEVYLLLGNVRIEGGEDTLDFRSDSAYLLSYPQPVSVGSGFLDSLSALTGDVFEEVDLSIERGVIVTSDTTVVDQSIYVRGYLNGDTTQVFTFLSDMSERIRFREEFTVDEVSVQLELPIVLYDWFFDPIDSVLLDPRDEQNRSDIEGLIKDSFDFEVTQ